MTELTQAMIDEGATFIDNNGIPTRADGTPIRGWGWGEAAPAPPAGDGGSLLAQIAWMSGQSGDAPPSDGRGGGVEGKAPPEEMQIVEGFPYPEDPLSYGFGPYYRESPQDYPDNRTPMDPEWQYGMEGGDWTDYYTPNDRSTGGGFFLAKDAMGGEVPFAFQEGASSPSTNNWRLFGGRPGYVMRNGRIIDLNATDLRGPPVPDIGLGGNYGGPLWNLGAGAGAGYPAAYNRGYTNFAGWPGTSNWANIGSYWIG